MLRQLGKRLGMFEIYARLYPASRRLKESLVDAYVAFLGFCLETKTILNDAKCKRSSCKLYLFLDPNFHFTICSTEKQGLAVAV
jgi:hypothetical protein